MSVLEFASGLRAHIFVSWLHPYKEQRLVVVGDHAMVEVIYAEGALTIVRGQAGEAKVGLMTGL